ncbi:MAG: zinc ribbon domain-containing protein [Oscillospiraceae bacterium]|nr:zinc ribbon domain-containing protein [Oscillospiraceae bacterium]
MRCPECQSEIGENDVFCGVCGAEIIVNDTAVKEEKAEEPAPAKKKKSKKGKNDSADGDKRRKLNLIMKIVCAAVVLAIIIVAAVYITAAVKASRGKKIFDSVPLGRDIAKIEADTGVAFLSGESSLYGAVNHIADYDYICESEKCVTVSGITVPEWVVVLKKGEGDSASEAKLYNFSILKHNWMGQKTASKIETSVVEFGMSVKAAERALGLKPYTIKKESVNNTSTYVYRYHYIDSESGNTVVKNFCVTVSDVDGQVKDVTENTLDYLNMILQAE